MASSYDRKVLYICFHCQKQVDNRMINVEPSKTIEEMRNHWQSHHSSKPFLYHAIGLGACFYCEKVDTYLKLQDHHNANHPNKTFIVVDQRNRSKCGLCQLIFTNTDMQIHFKREHNFACLFGIFSPICFTQKEIDRLILNGIDSNGVSGNPKSVQHFICGHCSIQNSATTTSLKHHYEKDKFLFGCLHCQFSTKSKIELFTHDKDEHNTSNPHTKHLDAFRGRAHRHYLRTKIIFPNGLVLFNHNLLGTEFDDRSSFWPFVDSFASRIFPEPTRKKSFNTCVDSKLPPTAAYHARMLEEQRKFRNNLCICGIENVEKELLLRHFMDICDAIGVSIQPADITSIFRRKGKDVIAQIADSETKSRILKAWNELHFDVNTSEILHPISIQNDMTFFFKNLWKFVEDAKRKNQIYSFWISDTGLKVKKTVNSKSRVIWSEKSLLKYISDK